MSNVLQDFTLIQEVIIAWAHAIIPIIKLRPSDVSNLAFYLRLYKYIVVLPKKLGLLLNVLLSRNFYLYDIICVI